MTCLKASACLLCLLSLAPLTFAEDPAVLLDEILVLGEKIPQPKAKVASSVTTITQEQLRDSQKQNVYEVLQGVAGVDVVTSGGPGGNVAVFMRGANSEHTLVYIDGIEANDPISPTRAFNFANLSLDNIERIEIIRGPQSTLYGSDAIGGVILITTKKGEGTPKGFVSAETGSYQTTLERAGMTGSAGDFGYSLGASRRDLEGFSAADSRDGNTESDGHHATSLSSRFDLTPSQTVDVTTALRYNRGRSELDNLGGAGGDDPNRVLDDRQFFGRSEVTYRPWEDVLTQKYGISYTDQSFVDNNYKDGAHPSDQLLSNYNGKLLKFDLQNTIVVSPSLKALIGLETKQERGSSSIASESSFGPYTDILEDKTSRNNGYYTQAFWDLSKNLSAIAGIRTDVNPKFGSETTWKFGPVLNIDGTKFSGTVGTGYKAPSLFQLYSSYGNEDLNPEKSLGWDVGVEQELFDKSATAGIRYFRNTFDNLITFDPTTFISENIAEAESHGIEFFSEAQIFDDLTAALAYNFTDTEDRATGQRLLRRPKNKVSAHVNYNATERLRLGAEWIATSLRNDNDFSTFPASRTELAGYGIANLTSAYKISETMELFGRIDNLFDKNYQEVLGFGSSGVAGYGGIKVTL